MSHLGASCFATKSTARPVFNQSKVQKVTKVDEEEMMRRNIEITEMENNLDDNFNYYQVYSPHEKSLTFDETGKMLVYSCVQDAKSTRIAYGSASILMAIPLYCMGRAI